MGTLFTKKRYDEINQEVKDCEEILPDEYRFHLELMIYTHTWESRPFLKTLYRIAKP
jgi:hypothetical protein